MRTKLLITLLFTTALIFAQVEPVVQNSTLESLPYLQGDPTTTSRAAHWINLDLGEIPEGAGWTKPIGDGESFRSDGVKFNDGNSHLLYQEIAVTPNTLYEFSYLYRKSGDNGGPESILEFRILKGSGYVAGYVPGYETDAQLKPIENLGYRDITEVEKAENNIKVQTHHDPNSENNFVDSFTFNSGSETSIAILSRSYSTQVLHPLAPYPWIAGSTDARVDSLELKLAEDLSNDDVLNSKLQVFPNPVKDNIQIRANGVRVSSVAVFNMLGDKVVSETNLIQNKLDVSALGAGVYLLKINVEGTSINKRIVIE